MALYHMGQIVFETPLPEHILVSVPTDPVDTGVDPGRNEHADIAVPPRDQVLHLFCCCSVVVYLDARIGLRFNLVREDRVDEDDGAGQGPKIFCGDISEIASEIHHAGQVVPVDISEQFLEFLGFVLRIVIVVEGHDRIIRVVETNRERPGHRLMEPVTYALHG